MGISAREEILGRVRRAVGDGDGSDWGGISRDYRRSSGLTQEETLELLEDRLRDYEAGVYRASAGEVQGLVSRLLEERGKKLMAVPAGFPVEWMPEGVRFVEDARGDVGAIDACEGVLTTATLAIALTGTIVLQDAPGQGRRAVTLLPDYHLCVVLSGDVVETVPEAMGILQGTAGLATTFFSGPSATADIEMTRIKGVHGPRFVDVVLVV